MEDTVTTTNDNTSLDYWHRRLCLVTDWLVLSGDLHESQPQAEAQIRDWRAAGITAIIDARQEWTDEELVAEIAPELRYWNLGTHDNGGHQDDAWFDSGVAAYLEAIARPGARLLVHCHMGINRGPSMGFRLLLEAGVKPTAALTAIRKARPIAAIAYAGDAMEHFHRSSNASALTRERDMDSLEKWSRKTGIGIDSVIRRIRERVL